MRVSTVALCTLALLSAEELSSTAIANPTETPNPTSDNVSINTEDAGAPVAVVALPSVEMAEPESSALGESSKNLSLLATDRLETSLALVEEGQEVASRESEPVQTSLAQPS